MYDNNLFEDLKKDYARVLLSTGVNDTETMKLLQPVFNRIGCTGVELTLKVVKTGDGGLCTERKLRMYYQDYELSLNLFPTEEVL